MADRTPTRDRPPVPSAGWAPVDGHHVGAADQATMSNLEVLALLAPALARSAPSVLAMMRGHQTGQPRAAAYASADTEAGDHRDEVRDHRASLWCFTHEQSPDRCDSLSSAELARCEVVSPTGPKDTTGEAGIVRDQATIDRAEFERAVARCRHALDDALAIASGYPAVAMEPAAAASGPGDDLCRSHWKANKYAKLIETDGDGRPYYSGLCRWCGSTRRALGGNYFDRADPKGDPPTFLVEAHIIGSVPQALVDKAQRQMDGKIKLAKKKAEANAASRKKKRK